MKIGIYLNYIGLGANLLHLSYCHEIAKKYGPVTIITICKNLKNVLEDDPLIKEIHYIEKFNKSFFDILKLSNILKKFNFHTLLIFYPGLRLYLAAKLSKIKIVKNYSFFKKKNLNLIHHAKNLTENFLNIDNCPTETKFYFDKKKLEKFKKEEFYNKFKIVIGAGSSGPTTRWGSKNYIKLINQLNKTDDYFFFILCGPNEKEIERDISTNLEKKNYLKLSDKKIKDVIPYLSLSNLYVGNDSFGSHITSQSGIKSFVFLLDTPKTYTDYSKNFERIIPENYNIEKITHGSNIHPNLISVDKVYRSIIRFKNSR